MFYTAVGLHRPDDDHVAQAEAGFVPGRAIGVHDGAELIATSWSFGTRTVVPGGALLSAAGVSRVGVRADHTRRGLLSAMMRAQLTDLVERGEVLASLRATEGRIYGRFGYGVATRGRDVSVRRAGGSGFRANAPIGGTVRLIDPADAVAVLSPLHERIALVRTGGITRYDEWWSGALAHRVTAREHLVVAVHTGPDGDDGFAVGAFRDGAVFTERALHIDDLHAADLGAASGLWRFLLGVDLAGTVEGALRPLDEPLELMLANPRDVTTTSVRDETWLRIVDVPAALAARSYGAGQAVTIAVHDRLLADNAGVYRVADGAAELVGPIGGPVPHDLECDVTGLAMAYLGDRRPSELVATGWWSGDPAAAQRADALFGTDVVPWCGTFF